MLANFLKPSTADERLFLCLLSLEILPRRIRYLSSFFHLFAEHKWCGFLPRASPRWCSCGFFGRQNGADCGATFAKTRPNVGGEKVALTSICKVAFFGINILYFLLAELPWWICWCKLPQLIELTREVMWFKWWMTEVTIICITSHLLQSVIVF